MKYRKRIEIGENVIMSPPFLPRMQAGQHITVDGNPGRWVGLSAGGVVWIVWPNTCGRSLVPQAIRKYAAALRELRCRAATST